MNIKIPLYELYGLWHEPFWQQRWFIALVAFLALLLCAIVLWLLFKWWRKKRVFVRDPYEEALQKLDILKQQARNNDNVKVIYHELTFTLKRFLARSLGINIQHVTDTELRHYLKSVEISQDSLILLNQLLNHAVLVKFANKAALQQSVNDDLEKALLVLQDCHSMQKKDET